MTMKQCQRNKNQIYHTLFQKVQKDNSYTE